MKTKKIEQGGVSALNSRIKHRKVSLSFKKNIFLYVLLLPAVVLTFIFAYMPMP